MRGRQEIFLQNLTWRVKEDTAAVRICRNRLSSKNQSETFAAVTVISARVLRIPFRNLNDVLGEHGEICDLRVD